MTEQTADKRSGSGEFNSNIHGGRGLFSLMIFIFHVYFSGLMIHPLIAGSIFGTFLFPSMKYGVELFFGISGVVIVGALRRAPSIRFFIWERMTRIYPVLWISIVTISVLSIGGHRVMPSFGLWLANFLAPPPFFKVPLVHPAAWSLGYEITFYALCAAAWYVRGKGFPLWKQLAALVGTVLIILYPRAILMPAGVLIAMNIGEIGWLRRWARYPLINLAVFMLGWRFIDLSFNNFITHASPLWTPWSEWIFYAPFLLIFGIFGSVGLLGIYEGFGWLSRLLRTRGLQWLGTISYSFYLWHPIVMSIVKQGMNKTGLTEAAGAGAQISLFIIALPPALIVSHFSQILLEKRLTRWLRQNGRKRAQGYAPVTATATE